jgi:hypothetical protein
MGTDRIQFVRYRVDTDTHGFVGECIDVRINGESIIPLDADGDDDLAGLPLDVLRANVGRLEGDGIWQRQQILRCNCGDHGCAGAVVELCGTATEILWRDAHGQTRQGEGATFRFGRDDWQAGLAAPPFGGRH